MLSDVLGLAPAESEIYGTLISVASATPAELAGSVGRDARQVERILGMLEGRGLATRGLGDTTRFVASPPAAALRALLVQRQNDLRLAELELDSLDEIYRAAAARRGVGDVIDVIHGTETIRERLGQMQLGAQKEIMNLVKAPVFSVGNMTDGAAIARGVRYRVILERAMLDEGAPSFDEIVQARAAGEEVRITETVPLKLFIVDREFAVVPLLGSADAAKAGALFVHASTLLDALIALFESEWGKATQFVTSAGALQNAPAIDDLDAQILSLSLAGLTDKAIAAQLHSSLRTVQRRIRHLMDVAKVQNRMQLGFQAARLGWLEAE
ncbi:MULTISPECIES: helix-turn-helix domain-containing protein [unclassified Streptomyces]|uniref:helix-turn-helix domain-containing protein n=1 Tax=unclassified Streptomyces TaxID=2593676 RepID=UPI00224F58FD|nr:MULTISPECIES: helix-turn-helix domain-containing protein [unclassified Streptomyces]WSP59365.1 LuxR C-terminal-related transcriptional regulator [Streptomyces sp. NBC_01241]WSU20117.1 LuxR C-terminal-related transcriptional regulator [Streptomyces sp. NBC_01108]MCX4791126.1 LuxR C-terminal-related transcriptional regulator [Streptomyces sp. NBC_01221]MCX4793155.1 LuxR C-terminal-related transcriptional regulator [Streptomyces sp. NBC_01242]WSP61044.1 LuxR C-terminal-related transcriptional 